MNQSNNTNSAISTFQSNMEKILESYYRSATSDNAKRGWEIRRRNAQRKLAM